MRAQLIPLLCMLAQETHAVGRTIADCQAVAGLFSNTCASSSTPIDFAEHSGEVVSCSGLQRCPGSNDAFDYTIDAPCTWQRKLCVTCSESNGDVYIRVQSNSLPNHCFYTFEKNPVETVTDWQVKFNPDPIEMIDVDASLGITGCPNSAEIQTVEEKKRRVLVIGIDGCRPDSLDLADTPAIDKLRASGLSSMEAMTQMAGFTHSAPGWHSTLLGVEPSKHHVYNNWPLYWRNQSYKSFLWHGRNEYGFKTMATTNFSNQAIPASFIEDDATDLVKNQSQEDFSSVQIADEASITLQEYELVENDYEMVFLHLDAVDHAGHTTGFSPDNTDYLDAITAMDS